MPNGGNDTYIANRQARYETTDEIQYPSIRQHAPPRAHVPLKGQGGIKQYVDLAGQGAFGSEYAHAYGVAATPTPANAGGLGTGYQGYGQKSGLFHKIAIGKLQVQDPVQREYTLVRPFARWSQASILSRQGGRGGQR